MIQTRDLLFPGKIYPFHDRAELWTRSYIRPRGKLDRVPGCRFRRIPSGQSRSRTGSATRLNLFLVLRPTVSIMICIAHRASGFRFRIFQAPKTFCIQGVPADITVASQFRTRDLFQWRQQQLPLMAPGCAYWSSMPYIVINQTNCYSQGVLSFISCRSCLKFYRFLQFLPIAWLYPCFATLLFICIRANLPMYVPAHVQIHMTW